MFAEKFQLRLSYPPNLDIVDDIPVAVPTELSPVRYRTRTRFRHYLNATNGVSNS